MIISKETAELLKDSEDYVHINGFGKVHIVNFPIETEDYLSKEAKPKLTDKDHSALVGYKKIFESFQGLLSTTDNQALRDSHYLIMSHLSETLNKFKD